jgi:hypothetical protein
MHNMKELKFISMAQRKVFENVNVKNC